MVINYDMPNTAEDYVHRIGRTGRAGARGLAVSFFTMQNARLARQIADVLTEAGQLVPPQLADYAATASGGGGGGVPLSLSALVLRLDHLCSTAWHCSILAWPCRVTVPGARMYCPLLAHSCQDFWYPVCAAVA